MSFSVFQIYSFSKSVFQLSNPLKSSFLVNHGYIKYKIWKTPLWGFSHIGFVFDFNFLKKKKK